MKRNFTKAYYQFYSIVFLLSFLNCSTIAQSATKSSDQSLPFLEVESFLIYSKDQEVPKNLTKELNAQRRIQMSAADTYFELRFLENTTQQQIAYQLGGMEEVWHFPEKNIIRLYCLPAGQYELRIRERDEEGQWSTNHLSIPIIVSSAFTVMSFLLYFLYGVVILGGILYICWHFYRQRQRQKKLEEEVLTRTQAIHQQTAKLQELNITKSSMFAEIIHEIRSPLTLMMGLNEAIMSDKYGNTNLNIKGATEVALKNGKKAIKLIEEILELSKLEMIQVRLEERPVYFYSFVYGLYTMLKPRAELKNIHFQMELKIEKGTRILLDLTKFEKIFNNLVGNAIKFTPEGGKVTVILENLNGSQAIRLRVTDSGPGIDKEHLDAIFDRYYQCKNGTLQSGPGIGIGLALVKSYADLFEGQLKVESEKGSGATFEFQFAKKSVAAKQSASEMMDEGQRMDHPLSKEIPRPPLEEVPTLPSVAKRSKILIVEDNHDMAQFIKELLIANYQVIRAEDGIQALALLSQNEGDIDCVVSDIKMPNMDGLELLQHIRANDEWRSLPFLMLTAEVRVSQRFDAFTFGVDDYLIKPFSSDELLKRVKSLLHNSKQRSAWQTKENEQVPPGASKNSPQMTESDLEWLRDLEDIAAKEVSNRRFNLLELSSKMAVSERQLFRRIKRLTGMTPNKYLREMKLYKAKDLLENLTYGTISEVSYAVGFEDPYYFSKIYTMRFGKRPSEYLSKDNSLLKNG